MRIADKMQHDQVKGNLHKNRKEMADLQNQAATQKRLTKPSVDPLAATRVLTTRTDINSAGQFIKNSHMAKTFLEYSDQSLGELTEVLVRAKELAINQANDASANDQTRQVAATEIEQLFNQSVQIGNRKLGDRFLFGGYRTTKSPFEMDGNYLGDSGEMKVHIDKEATVSMNVPGNIIFLGRETKAPANAGPDPSQNFSPAQTFENDPPAQGLPPPPSKDRQPPAPAMRGPASVSQDHGSDDDRSDNNLSASWAGGGTNLFKVLKDLESSLRTNDKSGVQDSIDSLDSALAQVVLARSQVGSRVGTINSSLETLQKGQVDSKTLASSLEDADTFELVSDINKTESTLKSTLATTGKLIQPSLLDFLR